MKNKMLLLAFALLSIPTFSQTNIQWNPQQFNNNVIMNSLTATTVPYLDSSKIFQSSAVTPTELGFVHNVTSSLCGINQSCTFTNKTIDGGSNTLTNLNASNLSSGTVGAARLPNPTASTLGGIESLAATSHQWINTISTSGVPSSTQPAFSDISGTASLTTQVTGVLPVGNGGTGQSAFTDGQLMIGNSSSGLLSKATLTPGSNITITNGNGSITIAASGSAASAYNYTAQTTTYSAVINDWVVASGASFAITLPTAASQNGKSIVIQHNGTSLSQLYTLNTTSAQTINGPAGTVSTGNYVLYTNGETVWLFSDGSNWQVTQHKTETGWNTISTIPITATSAHTFTIPSSSVTAGAVYSNNGSNFIASATIASATTLLMSGTGTPLAATNTLTKVSGVGPATLSYTAVTNSAPVKGTTSIDQIQYRRVGGDSAEIWYQLTQSGTGTSGSGDYIYDLSALGSFAASVPISLPTVTTTGAQAELVTYMPFRIPASGLTVQSAANFTLISDIVPYSSTSFKIDVTGNANNGFLGVATPLQQLNSLVGITLKFTAPMLGWQP